MIEQALEAEVEQAVGRHYYAHGKAAEFDGPRALRNGVRRGCIDSAEGVIEFAAPQVRGLRRSEATYLFSRIVDHNLRIP